MSPCFAKRSLLAVVVITQRVRSVHNNQVRSTSKYVYGVQVKGTARTMRQLLSRARVLTDGESTTAQIDAI